LSPKNIMIKVNSVQLQQVLINVLSNGLDAIENQEKNKKNITISTSIEKSKNAIITISDSGIGVADDLLKKIFSTFQTSKSNGLGLGLAISRLIIESFKGKIWAEGNIEGGLKILIFLPCDS
jgi:C4-dicarboxylate-specific signal transduction histidine kinase